MHKSAQNRPAHILRFTVLAACDTKNVSIWLDINRKRIDGERYTDASWYIKNIVGRINKEKCVVQHFVFEENE